MANSREETDIHSCMTAHTTMMPTSQRFDVSTFKRHAKKDCTRAAIVA